MSSDEKSSTPVASSATDDALGEGTVFSHYVLSDETSHDETVKSLPEMTVAGVTTDGSDVEVLHEDSSDSIEVLDPDKNADRNSIRTLTADHDGSGNVSPIKLDEAMAACSSHDAPHLDDIMQRFNEAKLAPVSYDNIYDSSDYADDEDMNINRPDSLSLPKPLQYYERSKKFGQDMSESSVSTSSSLDALIEEVSKTPLSKQGTLTSLDGKVEFIATDLTQMIKMSSPMSQSSGSPRSVCSSTSGWSTSSASGWSYSGMSRSPSILTASPDDMPPVDPRAIMELEIYAQQVGDSLDHMMGVLANNLHKMSTLTHSCLDTYAEGVDNTCDAVDTGIKSMYALMAKCEELSKAMQPVHKLHAHVQELVRLTSVFEDIVKHDASHASKS